MTARVTTRPKPVAKTVICLRCDNPFASEGRWNHICPPCNRLNAKVGTPVQRVRATLPDPPDEDDDWR